MSVEEPFHAMISGDSERAQTWRSVFGPGEKVVLVPIKSPVATRVRLPPNNTSHDVYLLDVLKLQPAQFQRMIVHLEDRFEIPIEEIRDEVLRDEVVPLLAEDLTVSADLRFLL